MIEVIRTSCHSRSNVLTFGLISNVSRHTTRSAVIASLHLVFETFRHSTCCVLTCDWIKEDRIPENVFVVKQRDSTLYTNDVFFNMALVLHCLLLLFKGAICRCLTSWAKIAD